MNSSIQIRTPETADPHARSFGRVASAVLIVAALWLVSSQGYDTLVSALGLDNGYDGAPGLFTAYNFGWAAAALWLFRSLIFNDNGHGTLAQDGLVLVPILAGFALLVVYGLPLLPPVSEVRAPSDPPAFMFASAWYYLPKSAEILFQQVLAAAVILTAAREGYGLRSIVVCMATAFGGFHLLLAFDGVTPFYVARFTLSAILFGALLPFLYLRIRGGFRWAYSLHLGFYATDAILTHLILAAPPWA